MTKSEAIIHYRTTRALAAALGKSENTVSAWESIPDIHQVRLEAITGGELRADDEAWLPAEPRFSTEQFKNGRHIPNPIRPKE